MGRSRPRWPVLLNGWTTTLQVPNKNPARLGTPRFRRYEAYKVAHTVGAARRLGATSQDISQDLVAGALTLMWFAPPVTMIQIAHMLSRRWAPPGSIWRLEFPGSLTSNPSICRSRIGRPGRLIGELVERVEAMLRWLRCWVLKKKERKCNIIKKKTIKKNQKLNSSTAQQLNINSVDIMNTCLSATRGTNGLPMNTCPNITKVIKLWIYVQILQNESGWSGSLLSV